MRTEKPYSYVATHGCNGLQVCRWPTCHLAACDYRRVTLLDAKTLSAAHAIARNPRVAFHPLSEGHGGVLLHLDTGAYHGINPVGSLVWQLLEQQSGLAQLIEVLRSRVEGAPANLDEEIAGFVKDLLARNLLTIEERTT